MTNTTWTVYVVICKTPNHVYVGITLNFYARKFQHCLGEGYGHPFTKKHGVSSMYKAFTGLHLLQARKLEKELAIRLTKHPIVVAGGWLPQIGLQGPVPPRQPKRKVARRRVIIIK